MRPLFKTLLLSVPITLIVIFIVNNGSPIWPVDELLLSIYYPAYSAVNYVFFDVLPNANPYFGTLLFFLAIFLWTILLTIIFQQLLRLAKLVVIEKKKL